MYWVYVLCSPSHRRVYVGHTDNLEVRFAKHDVGLVPSTAGYRPWRMLRVQQFATRAGGMKRERMLKSGHGREWIQSTLLARTLNRQSPPEAD